MKIPITKVSFLPKDIEEISAPLKSGWVVQGPKVREFEEKWCAFVESKYSVAVSNCTTALHLSLAACGIKEEDEVIVPSFTWVATANSVEYTGAKPVFCDVDLASFNIKVNDIERLITARTKAIIPVHLFGLSADMDEINRIARVKGLRVIEDAACGFGSHYKGVHVGNFGITGCFSFHPRKAITTGEGGMITTDSEEIYKLAVSMRDHGASVSDYARHQGQKPYILPQFPHLGYNYRMTDIQGALGSSQMDRADEILEKRRSIAEVYDNELKSIEWLGIPEYSTDYVHGYQSYVCIFGRNEAGIGNLEKIHNARNNFMDFLFERGISTRPGTHAVHSLEYYRNKYSLSLTDFPNSLIAYHCSIALPLFPSLTEDEQAYVIETIKEYGK